MRNVIVVTAREVSEKKMLFFGSLVLGVAVLATPLLPGVSDESSDVTAFVAFYLSSKSSRDILDVARIERSLV